MWGTSGGSAALQAAASAATQQQCVCPLATQLRLCVEALVLVFVTTIKPIEPSITFDCTIRESGYQGFVFSDAVPSLLSTL